MLIKRTSLFVIAVFIGLTVSPTYSGNIISCDSFETCPDGETSSAIITGLQAKIEEQEAKIAELEAEIVAMQVDLSFAELLEVRLHEAQLPNVIMQFASLHRSSLSFVNLTGADLQYTKV